ncbi:prenyltransferase/squalene oxidase repeat-containing protein [Desulfosarcina ovata]|uniref:Cycloartenol synthase n=1 Tax=Desulfosarcina ovata subsp. ovata TaxID=2752305 RepID=A0A5K8A561_9BACT|nr:prenyltransferase/squalene oxidase repeat-containing protein [Desulfosarcina ovata]BBO87576.1 cycloartenol synthase [Desulfosarcina ovata subsp. ovata]
MIRYRNKMITTGMACLLIVFFWGLPLPAISGTLPSTHSDISLSKEVDRTQTNGFAFLKKMQNPDGSWSNPDFPALTGLVLYAFFTAPDFDPSAPRPAFIQKGLDFIVGNAQANGSIYKEKLPNYNTAISMLALIAAGDPAYYPIIAKARSYVASLQEDRGKKGQTDDPYDGGIGYGTKDHSDMSNTYLALEALRMSEFLESDQHIQIFEDLKGFEKKSLDWDAALKFIQRCQNLPTHNDQAWASGDPDNKGGFVYFPGNSKAGEQKLPNGKVALRSYGSMTYAGLLSLIYADLKKDDPRVTAAYDWIQNNYTLEENPGLGQQGLFYYYHTMAKALTVLQVDHLTAENGQWIDWRKELTQKLVEKQKGDGSWINDSGRWWENDPVLVTAYSLIALNMIVT